MTDKVTASTLKNGHKEAFLYDRLKIKKEQM